MEKGFKHPIKGIPGLPGILAMLIAVRQVTMVLVTNSLHKVAETDHFIFYATDEDEALYSPEFLNMRGGDLWTYLQRPRFPPGSKNHSPHVSIDATAAPLLGKSVRMAGRFNWQHFQT